ncbi:MAG: hypothetical protein H0T79_06485 [Deltaproteobacteria bacterium]|nr:hypothetical protein [Deltaproteobacteria bacterium]
MMHASGLSLKTLAWDPVASWREVVSEKAGAKACGESRAQAFVTAWEGVLHAVMDDGGLMSLEPRSTPRLAKWKLRTGASSTWKQVRFPLVAFDAKRGVLVAWGSQKKSGGRKNETFVYDRGVWSKATKAKTKPADLELADTDAFTLFYDTAKQQVARLGKIEIAHFDGETWIATKVRGGKLLETWRRCVCHDPITGKTVIVNLAAREIVCPGAAGITKFGDFDPPAPRDDDANLPFDHWWFDAPSGSLIVHNEKDDAQSFALDLRPAFAQ